MGLSVKTMIEKIHSQIQEVLNDNVNKLDIQNALFQLEEVRDNVEHTEQLRVERDKTVEIVQQLWECIRRGYDYNESQIHMRAFNEGKTTVKKVVVEENTGSLYNGR